MLAVPAHIYFAPLQIIVIETRTIFQDMEVSLIMIKRHKVHTHAPEYVLLSISLRFCVNLEIRM